MSQGAMHLMLFQEQGSLSSMQLNLRNPFLARCLRIPNSSVAVLSNTYVPRRDIAQRPLVTESKARLHFVDDRFETVQAVLEAPDLRGTKLRVYLADW